MTVCGFREDGAFPRLHTFVVVGGGHESFVELSVRKVREGARRSTSVLLGCYALCTTVLGGGAVHLLLLLLLRHELGETSTATRV